MSSASAAGRYVPSCKLGAGAYGVVHKATDKETGRVVAVKTINTALTDEGMPCTSLREISVLRLLDHPNVVKLLDVVHDEDDVLQLAFEFVDRDLRKHLAATSDDPVDVVAVASLAHQLLLGIDYCHGRGIMHRDLKPDNVLVDAAGHLKIADFGLARAFALPPKPLTHEVVTLWYRAPEIMLGETHYSLGVDTWSAGCIFAELLRRKPLFAGNSEIDTLFRMFRLLGTPTVKSWPGVDRLPHFASAFPKWPTQLLTKKVPQLAASDPGTDLLKNLLTLDPKARWTAKAALQHRYFAQKASVGRMRSGGGSAAP